MMVLARYACSGQGVRSINQFLYRSHRVSETRLLGCVSVGGARSNSETSWRNGGGKKKTGSITKFDGPSRATQVLTAAKPNAGHGWRWCGGRAAAAPAPASIGRGLGLGLAAAGLATAGRVLARPVACQAAGDAARGSRLLDDAPTPTAAAAKFDWARFFQLLRPHWWRLLVAVSVRSLAI